MPYYQETLKGYFNYQEKYYLKALTMNLDYMEELDMAHPLNALARKMLNNLYNGPYERKIKRVAELVEELHAYVPFISSTWGCKQSAGGVSA